MSNDLVIADAAALEALLVTLSAEPRVGLDTEFHRERTYFAQLALVQLSWSTGTALIDPLRVDLRPMAALFAREDVLFIIHAATQDLEILADNVGSVPARLFDPQIAAGFLGYRTPSLEVLVRELLGETLSKGEQLTDWLRRPLTREQERYARGDVEHLFALHTELVERLSGRGRLSWAEEECERLRTRGPRRADPDTAWWRLKGQMKLAKKSAAIAQCLAAYREHEAARQDVPPRFILSDIAILGMAQRAPKSVAELASVRGLDAKCTRGPVAEAIVAAIQEGIRMPADELRTPPSKGTRPKVSAATLALCQAWIFEKAHREELDPAYLATREDLEAFITGAKGSSLATGFRYSLVGQELERLIEGSVAIAREGEGLRLVPV